MKRIIFLGLCALWLSACGPAVGSYEWCERFAHTDKTTWTDDDAMTFTNSCFIDAGE